MKVRKIKYNELGIYKFEILFSFNKFTTILADSHNFYLEQRFHVSITALSLGRIK